MSATTGLHTSLYISRRKTPSPSTAHHRPTTLTVETPQKSLLNENPLYAVADKALSSQIKEKIICLEIMGVDSGKALSLNPSLHTASLNSIESIISFLQSKHIHQKDLPRIFTMCPQILTSDIKTELTPVFKFLSQDLKIPDRNLRKAINKCPKLLSSNVENQLKPALFYLKRLGFKDLEGLAYRDAVLLVSSVEKTLMPKLEFLENVVGLSRKEAVGMVIRWPELFTYSVEKNLKIKFEYFVGEMDGKVEELIEFPQFFGFSLEKMIKARWSEVVGSGGGEMGLSVMLKSSDDEFNELIMKRKRESGF